jgi:hypothetical protein
LPRSRNSQTNRNYLFCTEPGGQGVRVIGSESHGPLEARDGFIELILNPEDIAEVAMHSRVIRFARERPLVARHCVIELAEIGQRGA